MNDVEARGLQVMKNIGLACFGDLGNIPISQAFPDSSVSSGEHFEFDYFVIVEDICFIGEITDRSSEKYSVPRCQDHERAKLSSVSGCR